MVILATGCPPGIFLLLRERNKKARARHRSSGSRTVSCLAVSCAVYAASGMIPEQPVFSCHPGPHSELARQLLP